jgi:hypothetical protein
MPRLEFLDKLKLLKRPLTRLRLSNAHISYPPILPSDSRARREVN